MTVRRLIEILRQLPQDVEVFTFVDEVMPVTDVYAAPVYGEPKTSVVII